MGEFDDLDTYNGDTEHDMWVDFTTNLIGKAALHQKSTMRKEYTGELEDIFDVIDVIDRRSLSQKELAFEPAEKDSDVDNFIDNLDDWD